MMVLCSACGAAVELDHACETCGEREPRIPASEGLDHEALLGRVGVALTAQADLARRRAIERTTAAGVLYAKTVTLQQRLRRQRSLMRRLMAERRELRDSLSDSLESVELALKNANTSRTSSTPRVVHVQLQRDVTCAAVARRILEDNLEKEANSQVVQDALLIVSELATNAVVHGRGRIELSAEIRDRRLRLEVCDEGRPDWIGAYTQNDSRAGGRGLWLVEQLSAAWGATTSPTRVWSELRLSP